MDLMNQDNIVHVFLNTLGDIIITNLLFILCCIPVITIGPALTALYHCMLKVVKGNSYQISKTFFRAFKENFIQSLVVWIGIVFFGLILFLNIRFLLQEGTGMSKMFFYLSGLLFALLVIIFLYIFPVIAAFANTLKNLLMHALFFSFRHFLYTLIIAVVTIFPMYMTYHDLKLMPLYACCWFFFGFGLTAYVNSHLLYKMFKPYLGEEEEDVEEESEAF